MHILRETFSESCLIEPNLDSNYIFPIDLSANGIPFGVISNGRVQLQSNFGLIQQYSKLVSLRVHTEKSFRNLIKLTRNQIVFTIFQLI